MRRKPQVPTPSKLTDIQLEAFWERHQPEEFSESFRVKAKPAIEELFRKEWPITTRQEVLAQ